MFTYSSGIIYVFVFIIYLTVYILLKNNKSKSSDLELVSDNFRVLARITNAIFLQSAVIQKSNISKEVIAEFLKTSVSNFYEIVDIDAQSAASVLKNLDGEVTKILERHEFTNKKIINEILTNLKNISSTVEILTKNPIDPNLTFENIKDSMREEFKNMSEYGRKCDKDVYKKIRKIAKIYETNRNEFNEEEAAKHLRELEKYLEPFRNCFKTVSTFANRFVNLPFWKFRRQYQFTKIAMDRLRTIIELTIDDMSKLQKDVEMSHNIWKDKSKSNLLGSFGPQISQTLNAFLTDVRRIDPVPPTLTVGFLKPKELLSVPKDLQNPWFKKYFIRGSSLIKDLSKALEPLNPISVSIQDLEKEWIDFKRSAREDFRIPNVNRTAFVLHNLENLVQNQTIPYDQILKSESEKLRKCVFKQGQDFFDKFELFEAEESESKTNNVSKVLDEIHETLRMAFTNDPTDEGISQEVARTCLNFAMQTFHDSSNSHHTKPSTVLKPTFEAFWYCTIDHGKDLDTSSFSKQFEKLEESLDSLPIVVEAFLDESPSFPTYPVPFQEILNASRLVETVNCLRDQKMKVNELRNAAYFVGNATNFPNSSIINESVTFLEHIIKVQNALKTVKTKIRHATGNRTKREASAAPTNPILTLKNSRLHSENMGICSLALWNLVKVLELKTPLLKIGEFNEKVKTSMGHFPGLTNYIHAKSLIQDFLGQAEGIEKEAKQLKDKDPLKMATVFAKMANLKGVPGDRQMLHDWRNRYFWNMHYKEAINHTATLLESNLDFATYQSQLLDGRLTVNALSKYFDEIFGHVKKDKLKTVIVEKHTLSWPIIIGIGIGSVFLLFVAALVIFGMTKWGRKTYRNWYLFYFGKPEEFEKRWRYSCFMDKVNGENALLDAVRETNKANLLVALKRGVYVNAYNIFGNTALHAATKGGHPDLVEALIRHGADRSLLNAKNRTPEQMVPLRYKQISKGKDLANFEKIQMIYKKYRKKNFRIRVPEIFPVFSFRIWPEERTDDTLTDNFMNVFQSITSNEPSIHMTHCVVKTDENGILETDNLGLLFWMFHGCIIVKEKWMTDCLQNEKLIEQDYNYLVEKVKYNGKIFDTVIQWSQAMAKSELPYLYGAQVAVVMKECPNLLLLSTLVNNHGGTMINEFPVRKKYTPGSHPYCHTHLGPLFLIHDGNYDLKIYQNDKMFTIFTEAEFIEFMLKRDIHKDTNENPVNVLRDSE
ncbi:hypothetical protein B9Z55_028302 [Caenorhabditis nigoni]|nr:hypothetical protein B9Z55_028302 [Caenorhabditis nigoni]